MYILFHVLVKKCSHQASIIDLLFNSSKQFLWHSSTNPSVGLHGLLVRVEKAVPMGQFGWDALQKIVSNCTLLL